MNIFEIKCACGGFIMGPREGGKARGRWLGYDKCSRCRAAEAPRPPTLPLRPLVGEQL